MPVRAPALFRIEEGLPSIRGRRSPNLKDAGQDRLVAACFECLAARSPSVAGSGSLLSFATSALASRLRVSWMEVRITEGGQGFGEVLEVLGDTPVSSRPGEGVLDHPAARQDDEVHHIVATLDDLHAQHRQLCHGSFSLPGVVAAIRPDQFEPGEALAYGVRYVCTQFRGLRAEVLPLNENAPT